MKAHIHITPVDFDGWKDASIWPSNSMSVIWVWCECVILSYKPNTQSPDSFLHRRCIHNHYSLFTITVMYMYVPAWHSFPSHFTSFSHFCALSIFFDRSIWPVNSIDWSIPMISSPSGPTSHPWPTTTMFCNCTPKVALLACELHYSTIFIIKISCLECLFFYFLYKRY